VELNLHGERAASWDSSRFRDIDTSVSTLLRQLLRAVTAMFTAFTAATLVSERAFGGLHGASKFLVGGVLFTTFGAIAIYVASARPIRRAIVEQRRVISDQEETLLRRARRQEFVADVQAAFEMEVDERGAIDVVGRALEQTWDHGAEFLLADSSRAHLRQAVVSPVADAPGCGVDSPWDCPAVRRGQTLRFVTSSHLGSCPHLRERGPGSAVCVPVTVLGNPMGVIHAIGPEGATSSADSIGALEVLASAAGSRLGMLRAISQSQLQAATDPLTGLLNRRSLEGEMKRLYADIRPYALLVADLDHFKDVNDTFGHETGDRALRLFARVMRESVRAGDLVCRFGGEEFVVVLPDLDVVGAAPTVHRIRDRLAITVSNGEVPPFTASFGLADSTQGSESSDVIRVADTAMFEAKQTGRDRLVIASGSPRW
jgi:diguanylate cyclase (GGDEF)-like protein